MPTSTTPSWPARRISLYGFGTAYLEKCTLSLRSCSGGVTRLERHHTTTFVNKYGAYIDRTKGDCRQQHHCRQDQR